MSDRQVDVKQYDTVDNEFADRLLDLSDEYYELISSRGECVKQNAARLFYDDKSADRAIRGYCRSCAVREECLQYAIITNQQAGTWGGFSESDRETIAIAARNEMRDEHPADNFIVPVINNEYMWTKTIDLFARCAASPHKLFLAKGKSNAAKKKKELNPLVQ